MYCSACIALKGNVKDGDLLGALCQGLSKVEESM